MIKFNRTFWGYLAIFGSTLFFSLSTVFAKIITKKYYPSFPVSEIVFARFFIGFILILFIKQFYKIKLNFINIKGLLIRAISNIISVLFFFAAIKFSTVSKSNILNMTYPFFVAIFSSVWLKEKITIKKIVILIIAFIGIYCVIQPNFNEITKGDFFGIASGICAGFAITSLKYIRNTDDTFNILFVLFSIGTFITLAMSIKNFIIPNRPALLFLILSGITAVLGQTSLTFGYKFCSAVEGSIISTFRIVIASILGIIIFSDTFNLLMILGSILIFVSNIFLNIIQEKNN